MGIVEELEKLLDDAREYLGRSIDNYKLSFIENLSLLLGDIACGIVVFILLFVIFMLLLALLAILLTYFIGILPALLVVALLIAALSFIVYKKRHTLFTDHFVRLLCGIIFREENDDK